MRRPSRERREWSLRAYHIHKKNFIDVTKLSAALVDQAWWYAGEDGSIVVVVDDVGMVRILPRQVRAVVANARREVRARPRKGAKNPRAAAPAQSRRVR